jgi:diguanylate cyclase (GGDEF)-like protein
MYKQYYKSITVICLLIFIIAYYFNIQNTQDEEISAEINQHIELIQTANEISSYAKRAEGHLLLFLMLESIEDREKFFKRAETLKELIDKLETLLTDDIKTLYLSKLYTLHNNLLIYGNKLLVQYDQINTQLGNINVIKTESELIRELHSVSSTIRKTGVDLVNLSTSLLHDKKELITRKNVFKYRALSFFTFVTFLFLIIITFQAGKLTVSTKVAESLEKLSYTDALTKIGNRRYFQEKFDQEWQRALRSGKEVSLLFIDVDYFKLFNDSYGHTNGDNCLVQVAQALKSCLKRPADVIARYGGEEFVIILVETSNSDLIAENCRSRIEELKIPHKESEVSSYVTISIGLGTVIPKKELSSNDFINKVDNALYVAKTEGRNCIKTALI